MADDSESKSLKEANEDIVTGVNLLKEGSHSILVNISGFLTNSLWGWLLSLVIGAAIGGFVFRIIGLVHSYFFRKTIPVNRDITLETLQGAPVGLSIVLLTIGLIIVAIFSYTRIVTLRQRVEKLEGN